MATSWRAMVSGVRVALEDGHLVHQGPRYSSDAGGTSYAHAL